MSLADIGSTPRPARPIERVDPGIGGVITTRDDGSTVEKYNPPQPALFAVIIDGIMTGELPWVLVILGAGLAIVMWLCGVSPLAFAVGVYLPLSTTFPIFVGGMVRGVVDRMRKLSSEESDSSPAVLALQRSDRRRLDRGHLARDAGGAWGSSQAS